MTEFCYLILILKMIIIILKNDKILLSNFNSENDNSIL